jgi:hypothetical protein
MGLVETEAELEPRPIASHPIALHLVDRDRVGIESEPQFFEQLDDRLSAVELDAEDQTLGVPFFALFFALGRVLPIAPIANFLLMPCSFLLTPRRFI